MDAGELVVGQALEDELESQVEHTYSMMACHGVYKYYHIILKHNPNQEIARFSGDYGLNWQAAGITLRLLLKL